MTNYITQAACGPVIGSVVSSDKGDIANRTKCAGAQLKNNVATLAQDVVVIGGAAGAGALINKNAKLSAKVTKFFDKVVNKLMPGRKRDITLFGTGGKPFKTFEIRQSKLAQKLLNMVPKGKIALAVALPALMAVSFISGKHLYKMGQIDQKYTDKAELRKHQDEVIK